MCKRGIYTGFINGGPLGKASIREHENEAGEDRIPNSNMAISEEETPTAPVLLKGSDITGASLAGRKPAELEKANLLFW